MKEPWEYEEDKYLEERYGDDDYPVIESDDSKVINNCENCTRCEGFGNAGDIAYCQVHGETLIKSGCKLHILKTDTFHPSRYGGDSKYECIKVLREWMTLEEYRGFCRGNAIKYLCRIGKKDDPAKELDKAAVYIGFLKETYQD